MLSYDVVCVILFLAVLVELGLVMILRVDRD